MFTQSTYPSLKRPEEVLTYDFAQKVREVVLTLSQEVSIGSLYSVDSNPDTPVQWRNFVDTLTPNQKRGMNGALGSLSRSVYVARTIKDLQSLTYNQLLSSGRGLGVARCAFLIHAFVL